MGYATFLAVFFRYASTTPRAFVRGCEFFRKSLGGYIPDFMCFFLMAFIRMVMFSWSWGVAVEVTILTYILLGGKLLPSLHLSIQILMGIPATWYPTSTRSKKSNKSLGLTEGQWWFRATFSTSYFWGKVVALRRMFGTCCISISCLTKFKIQSLDQLLGEGDKKEDFWMTLNAQSSI